MPLVSSLQPWRDSPFVKFLDGKKVCFGETVQPPATDGPNQGNGKGNRVGFTFAPTFPSTVTFPPTLTFPFTFTVSFT